MEKKNEKTKGAVVSRQPVVVVLGHVDHGKTTLLDRIRGSSVAEGEAGGMTQKIGAFVLQRQGKEMTFIDTPGHEAFAKMRSRGGQVADLAVLVVAANEGLKPQTIESLSHIKASQATPIVVVNKIDLLIDQNKKKAAIKKIEVQLSREGLLTESLGGKTVVLPVSAKTGEGVEELLETISLVWEVEQEGVKPNMTEGLLRAVVIESGVDPQRGVVATVVVKKGEIRVKEEITAGEVDGKVKSLMRVRGVRLERVARLTAGEAGEVLGWKKTPTVGSLVTKSKRKKFASQNSFGAEKLKMKGKTDKELGTSELKKQGPKPPRPRLELKLVLKADRVGSLEAIEAGLPENVRVIAKGTGDIVEGDIFLASVSEDSLVVGFNTKVAAAAAKLAEKEGVVLRTYKVIYELLEEISEVASGLSEIKATHEVMGWAKILAQFPYEKMKVAGVRVGEGRIARGDRVWVIQSSKLGEKEMEGFKEGEGFLGEARVESLRVGKEDVSKIEKSEEGGILLTPQVDFSLGDGIIAFRKI